MSSDSYRLIEKIIFITASFMYLDLSDITEHLHLFVLGVITFIFYSAYSFYKIKYSNNTLIEIEPHDYDWK